MSEKASTSAERTPPMDHVYKWATYIFDPLHYFWEGDKTQRFVAGLLVAVFLAALATIELNRHGMLPEYLASKTPTSHFMAISLAFTLVLILEVISLIFTIPCSISKAVGKQFEILALILLRGSFKELVHFPEPISLEGHMNSLLHIVSGAIGALLIFTLLGLYLYLKRNLDEEVKGGPTLFRFVAAKKIVALVLLGSFLGMGAYNVRATLLGIPKLDFFLDFYTILIFSDILLVLIAQRYLPAFRAVFRNSGFALATLLIRLSLTAPPYYKEAIGVGAAIYAVLLTVMYNTFYGPKRLGKK